MVKNIQNIFQLRHMFQIGQPSRSFSSISDSTPVCCTTQREDSNRLSLNWTIHDQAVELVVPQQGTVSPLSPFQLPVNCTRYTTGYTIFAFLIHEPTR